MPSTRKLDAFDPRPRCLRPSSSMPSTLVLDAFELRTSSVSTPKAAILGKINQKSGSKVEVK